MTSDPCGSISWDPDARLTKASEIAKTDRAFSITFARREIRRREGYHSEKRFVWFALPY